MNNIYVFVSKILFFTTIEIIKNKMTKIGENVKILVFLAKIALYLATIVTIFFAFSNSDMPHIHHMRSDKVMHFLAFLCLNTLSLAAYPKVSNIIQAGIWVFIGLAIEIVQGLPFIGRDKELGDWLVEIFAIFLVNSILIAANIRFKARK